MLRRAPVKSVAKRYSKRGQLRMLDGMLKHCYDTVKQLDEVAEMINKLAKPDAPQRPATLQRLVTRAFKLCYPGRDLEDVLDKMFIMATR